MEGRRETLLFIFAYATFVATAGLVLLPQNASVYALDLGTGRLIENIAMLATYLLLSVFGFKHNVRTLSLPWSLTSLAIVFLGHLAFMLESLSLVRITLIPAVVLHIGNGSSIAVLFTFWASASYLFDTRRFQLGIFAGSLISCLIVIATTALDTYLISFFVQCGLVIASGILTFLLLRAASHRTGGRKGEETKSSQNPLHLDALARTFQESGALKLLAPILCTCAFAGMYSFSWSMANDGTFATMFYAIGEAAAMALLFSAAAMPELFSHMNVLVVYRWLFPLACLSTGVICFVTGTFQLLLLSVLSAFFNLLLISLTPLCAAEGKKTSNPVVTLYGLAQSIITAFTTLGHTLHFASEQNPVYGALIVMLLGVAMYIATLLIPSDKTISLDFQYIQSPVSSQVSDWEASSSAIADEYGLTAREKDVLDLLVMGRDIPSISNELSISKNTIKTHVKRIYAKTGISSRQGIVDLVEQFRKSLL